MAENMQNEGEILALDIHPHRTKLVEETAKRLSISIIKTKVNDATIYNEEYQEKFDKILLDVPCLGLGVLKRKPDIKWRRKKEDIEEITRLQYQILNTCSKYLKYGGELVYSTCSILKEENEDLIKKFLNDNKEFELEEINLEKNNFFLKYIENKGFIKVFQNVNTDGFFICKLLKKKLLQ